jgi:hypothetical protein
MLFLLPFSENSQGFVKVFPTPFLSLPLILLSEELLFPMKAFQPPSFLFLYFIYPMHLFQSMGEALPSLEEGS